MIVGNNLTTNSELFSLLDPVAEIGEKVWQNWILGRWKVEKLEVEAECFTKDNRGGERSIG